MPRDKLHQRYLCHAAGWFSFRENIMRGYVRLRAEAEGINLDRHHNTAGIE